MPDQNINITVIVSGQPTSVKVNRHQKVDQIIKEALRETGNQGQPSSEWELRTSSGALISLEKDVDDAGITDGATLYLSPRAGAGGGQ